MAEWWNIFVAVIGHALFWVGALVALLSVPIGMPGTWVFIGLALVFALFTGFAQITWTVLLLLVAAATVGEIIEFIGGLLGARYGGAGKSGMIAATVGGLVGAIAGTALIPIPVIGSLLGAMGLCFAAVLVVEYHRLRDYEGASRAGFWALAGKMVSLFAKTAIGAAMAVWVAWVLYLR